MRVEHRHRGLFVLLLQRLEQSFMLLVNCLGTIRLDS